MFTPSNSREKPDAAISRIFPFRFAPVTEITCSRLANGAGFFSDAQPQTNTFACGLNFSALEMACRLLCSASAVTAQVLTIYRSAGSNSRETVYPSFSKPRIKDPLSTSLTLHPSVKTTAFIPFLPDGRPILRAKTSRPPSRPRRRSPL